MIRYVVTGSSSPSDLSISLQYSDTAAPTVVREETIDVGTGVDDSIAISVDASFSNFIGGVLQAGGANARTRGIAATPENSGCVDGWLPWEHIQNNASNEPWRKMPRRLGDFRVVDIPVVDGGMLGTPIEVKVCCICMCWIRFEKTTVYFEKNEY